MYPTDGYNLTGTIPLELALLQSLEELSLQMNNLSGTLPESFGESLFQLQALTLDRNQISGSIPESYSELRNLRLVAMPLNLLSGTIPSKFLLHLSKLEIIDLDHNFLSGIIPHIVNADVVDPNASGNTSTVRCGTCTRSSQNKLERLSLGNNMISGTIPESLYAHTNLFSLSLFDNDLSGTISTEIGNLQDMTYLILAVNHLSGTIPTEVGNMGGSVSWFAMNQNSITGTIPSELGLLRNMDLFSVRDNRLGGTVPIEVMKLNPKVMSFLHNNITGSFDGFCSKGADLITRLTADCGGDDPAVDCPCCARCCGNNLSSPPPSFVGGDDREECVENMEVVCQLDSRQYDHVNGTLYNEAANTTCDCVGDGLDITMVCNDECQTCNLNGTVCISSQVSIGYNAELTNFQATRNWQAYKKREYQYVLGKNDTLEFVRYLTEDAERYLELYVNGVLCNSIDEKNCDDSYDGFQIDCENVDGAGSVDSCSPDLEYDGPLMVFLMGDPLYRQGCAPRFPTVEW